MRSSYTADEAIRLRRTYDDECFWQISGPAEYYRARLDYEITPSLLKTLLERQPHNIEVLDVRDRELFAGGHIPGARNVPIDAIISTFVSMPRDKMFVTYCGDTGCDLSMRAALELVQRGFRVQNLLAAWSSGVGGVPVGNVYGEGFARSGKVRAGVSDPHGMTETLWP